eukprot:gene13838-15284_t
MGDIFNSSQFLKQVKERAEVVSKSARQKPEDVAEKFSKQDGEGDQEMQDYLAVIRGTEPEKPEFDVKITISDDLELDFASSQATPLDFSREKTKAELAQRRIQKRRRPQSWAWAPASQVSITVPQSSGSQENVRNEPDLSSQKENKIEEKKEISYEEPTKRPRAQNKFGSPASNNLMADLGNFLKVSKKPNNDDGTKEGKSSPEKRTSTPPKVVSPRLTSPTTSPRSPRSSEQDPYLVKTKATSISPGQTIPIIHKKENAGDLFDNSRVKGNFNGEEDPGISESVSKQAQRAGEGTVERKVSKEDDRSFNNLLSRPQVPPPRPKPKSKVSSSAMLAKTAAMSSKNQIVKEDEKKVSGNSNPRWLDELKIKKLEKEEVPKKRRPPLLLKEKEMEVETPEVKSTDGNDDGKALANWIQAEVTKTQEKKEDNGIVVDRKGLLTSGGELISKLKERRDDEKEEPSWLKELNKRKQKREVNTESISPKLATSGDENVNAGHFDYRSYTKHEETIAGRDDKKESSDEEFVSVSQVKKRLSKKSNNAAKNAIVVDSKESQTGNGASKNARDDRIDGKKSTEMVAGKGSSISSGMELPTAKDSTDGSGIAAVPLRENQRDVDMKIVALQETVCESLVDTLVKEDLKSIDVFAPTKSSGKMDVSDVVENAPLKEKLPKSAGIKSPVLSPASYTANEKIDTASNQTTAPKEKLKTKPQTRNKLDGEKNVLANNQRPFVLKKPPVVKSKPKVTRMDNWKLEGVGSKFERKSFDSSDSSRTSSPIGRDLVSPDERSSEGDEVTSPRLKSPLFISEKFSDETSTDEDGERKHHARGDLPKPFRVKLIRVDSFEQTGLSKPAFEATSNEGGKLVDQPAERPSKSRDVKREEEKIEQESKGDRNVGATANKLTENFASGGKDDVEVKIPAHDDSASASRVNKDLLHDEKVKGKDMKDLVQDSNVAVKDMAKDSKVVANDNKDKVQNSKAAAKYIQDSKVAVKDTKVKVENSKATAKDMVQDIKVVANDTKDLVQSSKVVPKDIQDSKVVANDTKDLVQSSKVAAKDIQDSKVVANDTKDKVQNSKVATKDIQDSKVVANDTKNLVQSSKVSKQDSSTKTVDAGRKKPPPPKIKPKPPVKPKGFIKRPDLSSKYTNQMNNKNNANLIEKDESDVFLEKKDSEVKENIAENKPATTDDVRLRSANKKASRRPVSMTEDTNSLSQYKQVGMRERAPSASSSKRFSTELEKKQCWFRGVLPATIENLDDYDDIPAWKKQLLARLKPDKPAKKPSTQNKSAQFLEKRKDKMNSGTIDDSTTSPMSPTKESTPSKYTSTTTADEKLKTNGDDDTSKATTLKGKLFPPEKFIPKVELTEMNKDEEWV